MFKRAAGATGAIMTDMTDVLAKLLESLANGLPQAVVNLWDVRRNGSVPDQLRLQSELKMAEQRREQELRRELTAPESPRRADDYGSPFGDLTDDEARDAVTELTCDPGAGPGGQKPALLFAPFLDTGGTVPQKVTGAYVDVHSLRFRWEWEQSGWYDDMAPDAGTIGRPCSAATWTSGTSARSWPICRSCWSTASSRQLASLDWRFSPGTSPNGRTANPAR